MLTCNLSFFSQRNHSGLDGLCPVDVWMAGSCRRFYGNNNTVSTSEVKTEQISEIRVRYGNGPTPKGDVYSLKSEFSLSLCSKIAM